MKLFIENICQGSLGSWRLEHSRLTLSTKNFGWKIFGENIFGDFNFGGIFEISVAIFGEMQNIGEIELLIFDVFKGQKTDKYKSVLALYDIVPVYVPANLTRYFQPLDLTLNGIAKTFLKDKFRVW